MSTHLEAAKNGTHANPILATSLLDGDFEPTVLELVEKQFPSRRHLRSFLLGREAYWMDRTTGCINLAKPERPALDLAGIQQELNKLTAALDREKSEYNKTRGFGERAVRQVLERTQARFLELEDSHRDHSTIKILGLRIPKRFRSELPKELLDATRERDVAIRLMNDLMEKRRKCEARMEQIEAEIFAQRFVGFQCGISISGTDWEPLATKDW